MKFCNICENMLFITVNEQKELVYFCKSCDKRTVVQEKNSICVIDDRQVDDDILFNQFLNKNLKYDPTVPRVNNIQCVNPTCTKEKDKANQVIYIKYDAVNMKYLYMCCYCDHFWKNT